MVRLRRKPLPPGVREIMRDRKGRTVVLTEDCWRHITRGHPEMDGLDLALKSAVESADIFEEGERAGSEKLCAQGLGPARWLVVVVAYGQKNPGMILTAYPRTRPPRSEERQR